MRGLLLYFARGILLTVPAVVTGWLFYQMFTKVDSWLGLSVPGAGFVITLVLITLVGFLGSNLLTRGLLAEFEQLMERLPLVRLVYNSTKDFIGAFVGEKKRFDKPVLVTMTADGAIRSLGFITQTSLDQLALHDSVVVYFPFSYSIAGFTSIVPTARVQRLDTSSSDLMAFLVSGGVVDFPEVKR
ncbi:MAG: DUF502 domain-containing protein [Gemmatimonadetes bacterium]|nr:DUF502 domain-containing protein [Gemmatimonadota bacterium]